MREKANKRFTHNNPTATKRALALNPVFMIDPHSKRDLKYEHVQDFALLVSMDWNDANSLLDHLTLILQIASH